MKRKIHILCLLLVIALLVSAVGCVTNSSKKEATGTVQEDASPPQDTEANKRYEVTYAGWISGPMGENTFVEKYLEEKFNVDITFWSFERSTYSDQFNVKLASGEIPDFFIPTNPQSHYQQKIIAPFKLAFIKESMPNFFDVTLKYNEMYDCQLWAQGRYDGENNYILPGMQFTWISPYALMIRKDWMDNIGITKVPETIEEFEVLLDKFRNDDPDKNGKKDTYPLTARGKDWLIGAFMYVLGAYGSGSLNSTIIIDGKAVKTNLTQEYKNALKKLNEWYKKEYIDPEFITTDNSKLLNDIATNKIGIIEQTWYRFYGKPDDILNAVKSAGGTLIYVKPPTGPEGHYGFPVNEATNTTFVFGTHLQKDLGKWKRILMMLDTIATDPETYLTVVYGKEGEHYDITDKGVVYKPDYDSYDKRKELGVNITTELWRTLASPEIQNMAFLPNINLNEVREKSMTSVQYLKTNNITVPREDAIMKERNEISNKANDIHKKWFVSFIVGEKSVDKDWDAYIKELESVNAFKYDYLAEDDMVQRKVILEKVQAEINALK